MGLFSRKQPPEVEQRSDTGLAYPHDWLLDALGGTESFSGERVSVNKAFGLAPVWSAVSIIAEQVGQLPLKVYQNIDGEKVEARNHRCWSMLHDKPNELTPAGRFWSTVTAHLLLWGNAFVQKRRNGINLVDELWLLHPAQVTVEWNWETKQKAFTWNPPSGQRQRYTTDEVLHIYGLSLDGVIGESVITRCKAELGTAIARDRFEGGFYDRGAVLSGVIQHPGHMGLEGLKNLKQSFMTIYSGSAKAHQVGVLEEGAEFKPMSNPLKDLEFVQSKQLSRTDIAVMFKLPPHYLGGSTGDSMTYSTVESSQIQFALHAIAPWTTAIAKALTHDSGIFPQSIHEAEFTLEAMMRANAKERGDFYKVMSEIGAMDINEIRARENMPPKPDGDRPGVPPGSPLAPAPSNGNGVAPVLQPSED